MFPARGGARRVKVDNEIGEAAMKIVDEHSEFTLQQINNELRLWLPHKPSICLSSLRKALRCQLITLKTMENVPVDRNRDDVKMSRLMFAEWLLQNEQEIISIDESGFHLWLSRSRGRTRRGQRALRIVGAHFSFILALSNQRGVIHHMIHN